MRICRMALAFWPALCAAQSFEPYYFNPLSTKGPGLHLHSVNVSASINSGTRDLGVPDVVPPGQNGVVSIVQAGGVIGWARAGSDSNISVTYSPSFSRGTTLLHFRSFNHALSVSGGRKLRPRLGLNGSLNVIAMDYNQLLNGSTPLGNLAGTPATFEDLSAAIITGNSQNPQLNGLTGLSPVVSSPETSFLYGVRHLSMSAGMSLSYELSTRSHLNGGVSVGRSQVLGDQERAVVPGLPLAAQLRHTTGMTGGAGWSYSLTPRDSLSVGVSTSRVFSDYQDAFVSQVSASFGRRFNERWFATGMVGMGLFNPFRETLTQGAFRRLEWGASVGYKVYAHTFLGSYTDLVSDVFGLGARSSITSGGAWSWKRPGLNTSLSSTFGYSQLVGAAFPNFGSWSASLGVGHALTSHTVLSVSYRYSQFPRYVYFYSPSNSVSGLMSSLSWSPSARE